WAAAEMGDHELYKVVQHELDGRHPLSAHDGALWRDDGSTQANAMMAMGRFSPPNGYRLLMNDGPGEAVLRGPYLEGAAYPDVLVANATTDGAALHLVLRPGNGPCRTPLGVRRLVAGRAYAVRGATHESVTAAADGSATVEVEL